MLLTEILYVVSVTVKKQKLQHRVNRTLGLSSPRMTGLDPLSGTTLEIQFTYHTTESFKVILTLFTNLGDHHHNLILERK